MFGFIAGFIVAHLMFSGSGRGYSIEELIKANDTIFDDGIKGIKLIWNILMVTIVLSLIDIQKIGD